MVRLEKIAYEKVVNNAAISRNRVLGEPRKWYCANPFLQTKRAAHEFNNSFFGKIFAPAVNLFHKIQTNLTRGILLQMGLAPEDMFLHYDAELRRNIFFEHVARETLHPYHWILKVKRRQRYYKVERTCRGFFVPEYLRNQASRQTYADCQKLQIEWNQHLFDNYSSDMTPKATRSTVTKLFPLELLINHGIWRPDAWDRYFMNQKNQSEYAQDQINKTLDRKKFPYNLTTKQGKKEFQQYVNDLHEKIPGVVASEGTKFDFKAYYAEIGV